MMVFIEDGLLDKHIRHSRRVYAERHHILAEALTGPLAGYLAAHIPDAGLHIAGTLRGGLREDEVLQAADLRGILTYGLSDWFYSSPAKPGLLIGFGAVSTADLPTALRTMELVLGDHRP
jgi:GntR family transcriptional regulator / MocR family aminotransferase